MNTTNQTHPADRTSPTSAQNVDKNTDKNRPAFGGLDKDKEQSTDMSKKNREQAERTRQPETGRTER